MSDYFAQVPAWKMLIWLIVLGVGCGIILWHICTGEKKKPVNRGIGSR